MPGGRPSKITTIVGTGPDGENITAADRIVQCIRMGGYHETAAAAAGVDKTTLYEWLKVGAQATDLHQRQNVPLSKLTAHQQRCMAFSHAVAEAEALSEMDDVATAAELAAGGRVHKVVTTKRNAQGEVLEHSERVETLQPNAAVLTWRLERRFPERYGRRRIEISGPDGDAIPVEVRVRSIVAAARAFHGEAIDARATETTTTTPDGDDDEAGDDHDG